MYSILCRGLWCGVERVYGISRDDEGEALCPELQSFLCSCTPGLPTDPTTPPAQPTPNLVVTSTQPRQQCKLPTPYPPATTDKLGYSGRVAASILVMEATNQSLLLISLKAVLQYMS